MSPVKVARGWDLEEDDMKKWSAQTGAGDSIVGTAELLRKMYGVPDNLAVLVSDKVSGRHDVSWCLILGVFRCCGSTVYGGRFWLLV
jgi:hypothetical protein